VKVRAALGMGSGTVRYAMLCYAMLCHAMLCWRRAMLCNGLLGCSGHGGEPASERLRCDERSGLVDWDIAARLEKREKAAGALIVWLRSPSYPKREKKFDFC
jgi:hypothetical protein